MIGLVRAVQLLKRQLDARHIHRPANAGFLVFNLRPAINDRGGLPALKARLQLRGGHGRRCIVSVGQIGECLDQGVIAGAQRIPAGLPPFNAAFKQPDMGKRQRRQH